MNNHISTEDWVRFFRGDMSLADRLPVLRHCAECSACKAIMDAGKDLQFLLENNSTVSDSCIREVSAFRAVAGADGSKASSGRSGFLTFRLDSSKGGRVFADEDPEAGGWGNRYAMNRSADGRQFIEDGGALFAEIDGNKLLLTLNDPGVTAWAHLICDGTEPDPLRLPTDEPLLLPAGGFCELEIVFEEA